MPVPTRPKPLVFCLYKVDKSVVEYGRSLFEFVTYDDPRSKRWKEEAEGVMVRSQTVTAEEVSHFGTQLKFVQKHGVGVDNLAVKAMRERGVVVMNTAGVNVSEVCASDAKRDGVYMPGSPQVVWSTDHSCFEVMLTGCSGWGRVRARISLDAIARA